MAPTAPSEPRKTTEPPKSLALRGLVLLGGWDTRRDATRLAALLELTNANG